MTEISKFTSSIGYIPAPPTVPEPWLTAESFRWLLDFDDPSKGEIIVPAFFPFDGASVPAIPVIRIYFPRVHPGYMQSAALHDWCLKHERHRFSREEIDLIFAEALLAQKNPEWRIVGMYAGVSAFGKLIEGEEYYVAAPHLNRDKIILCDDLRKNV